MRSLRVVAIASIAAALATASFPAFLALRSMGTKIFEPQPFDFALLFAAAFGIVLGLQVVAWRGSRYIVVTATLASGFLLFGFLAAFSIGLAFLPAGVVLLLLLYRGLRRMPPTGARARSALGGAAIGFALPLLYIALIVPATVECMRNGGSTSSGRWRGGSQMFSTSGGMGVDPNGVVTGRIEYTDSVVTFRCEGGRVVEFRRAPR
jgi:hypothetical protein